MKTQLQAIKGIRKTWGILNPATTRIESKKIYSRKNKWNKVKQGIDN